MIHSLGEAVVFAAQQRVEPETFSKFQFRLYCRVSVSNEVVFSGLPVIRPEPGSSDLLGHSI
jgi:hypothetical protein